MSVSIRACPSCNTLLLDDTVQCPSCDHILDPERAASFPSPQRPTNDDANPAEDPCPNCGEMVRRGLVRCWNCGTFMRQDIAQLYQKMQTSPRGVIFSTADESLGSDDEPGHPAAATPDAAGDDDFELGATDEDFELAPDITTTQAADEVDEDLEDEDFVTEPQFASQPTDADSSAMIIDDAELTPLDDDAPLEPADEESASSDDYEELTDELETPPREHPPEPTAGDEPPTEDEIEPLPPAVGELSSQTADESGSEIAHSVATGGDVLLQVALEEEAEKKRRRPSDAGRRGGGPRTGFLVYCPNGHRIEVQERHRGLTGRCPKCREQFLVPTRAWQEEAAAAIGTPAPGVDQATPGAKQASEKVLSGSYTRWIADAHLHQVDPAQLKLKPGSLQKDFQTVDIGFAPDGMLIALLVKKGGLFGGVDKKKAPAREAMFAHLEEEKPLGELPVAEHYYFDADQVREIRVVQPAPYAHESMFAGVAVFGEGHIAVRLPKTDNGTRMRFLSFMLSEFREFAEILADMYIIQGLGEELGVPLSDEVTEYTCHYSDEKLRALEHLEFYQADPQFALKLIGRRCQECGLVVSEDSRKKEKIGGKSGRGIAKALCPKCKRKFGDNSLFALEKPSTKQSDEKTADEETAEHELPAPEAAAEVAGDEASAAATGPQQPEG